MENELVKIKQKIDQLKQDLATCEGRKKELLTRLKEEFNLSNPKEAKKHLTKLNKQLAKLKEDSEKLYNKIKEELDKYEL